MTRGRKLRKKSQKMGNGRGSEGLGGIFVKKGLFLAKMTILTKMGVLGKRAVFDENGDFEGFGGPKRLKRLKMALFG